MAACVRQGFQDSSAGWPPGKARTISLHIKFAYPCLTPVVMLMPFYLFSSFALLHPALHFMLGHQTGRFKHLRSIGAVYAMG
jgi:hypothetical protein